LHGNVSAVGRLINQLRHSDHAFNCTFDAPNC
jgi:hypothetical protein